MSNPFPDPTDPRSIVSKFLTSLTSGQVGMYVRIALYAVAGAAASKGWVSQDNSYVAYAISVGTFGATLAWTIWGNRLVARIESLMATGRIRAVVPKESAVAAAVPDPRVTAAADTQIIVKPAT